MALAPRPWCRTPPAGHGAAGELSPMVPACWVGCSALGTAPWSGTLPSLWGDGELDTWRVHTYTAPSLPCCCLCCVAVLHRGGDGCQGWAPLLHQQQWNLLCPCVLVALGGLGAAAWLCQGDASPTRSTSAPQHRCSECSSLPQMVSVQIRALCRTRAKHAPNLRRGVVRQRR